jgi:peptidoglycan glycosyltransferase
MNAPIVRMFGLVVVLFALLIVWTSRWTVIDANSLNNNPLNVRPLLAELHVKGGRILAADGSVLAKPVPGPGGTWGRAYPTGPLFAQAIGYQIAAQGRSAGLEAARAGELRGDQTGLGSIFGQLTAKPVGNDVYTTLDPKAQRAAQQALAGQNGSVVALDPRTGAVLVMYANPTYDDNHVNATGPTISSFNRTTQGSYAPGSTFKIVTATAAVDSGKYNENSVVNGNSPIPISGVPLNNDNNQSWGPQNLITAMTYSINTIFAQLAENVGRPTMTKYMQRFGFYAKPPLDYPPSELRASRPYSSLGRPYPPGSPQEDIGRIGIGQGGLQVTPLQMAMVAAAVANGGKLMAPHLTSRIVNQDGATVQTIKPTMQTQVMSQSSAQQVTRMMEKVVESGTGTTVQLPGVTIAGKTGTASIGIAGSNLTQPSFVAFAPAQNPKIAIAVMVDRSQGGFGATVAAPIAKAVLQTLLSEGR